MPLGDVYKVQPYQGGRSASVEPRLGQGSFLEKFNSKLESEQPQRLGTIPDKREGFFGAVGGGVENVSRYGSQVFDYATGDLAGIEETAAEEVIQTKEQAAFGSDLQKRIKESGDKDIFDAISNVAGAAWDNPAGAWHELGAQLPNMGVIMSGAYAGMKGGAGIGAVAGGPTGGIVGGIIGGIAGMFAGNTIIEAGAALQEEAVKNGMITPEQATEAVTGAAKKASVITAVDTATLGFNRWLLGVPGKAVEAAVTKSLINSGVDVTSEATKRAALSRSPELFKKATEAGMAVAATQGRQIGRHAVAGGLETLGEGTGEYFGTVAQGKDPSLTEATLESLMSAPMSAVEIAFAKKTTLGKFSKASDQAPPAAEDSTTQPTEPHPQLDLFTNEQMPEYASRDEEKGTTRVVNPATGAEIQTKPLEDMMKTIAILEAKKKANPAQAEKWNRGIRSRLNLIRKKYQSPGETEKDINSWSEAQDILDYYKNILDKEKRASTKKAEKRVEDEFDVQGEIKKSQDIIKKSTAAAQNRLDALDRAIADGRKSTDEAPQEVPIIAPVESRIEAIKAAAEKAQVAPEVIVEPSAPVEASPKIFGDWFKDQVGDTVKYSDLTQSEKSEYSQEYKNYKETFGAEVAPTVESGMRDIAAVTDIPAPKKAKAPPKPRAKKPEPPTVEASSESLPEGYEVSKAGNPYKTSKSANTALKTQKRAATHKTVKLSDGVYAHAPLSEEDKNALAAELTKKVDTQQREAAPTQNLEVGDEGITPASLAKLEKRWNSVYEIKKGAEYVETTKAVLDSFNGLVAEGKENWNSPLGRQVYERVKSNIEGPAAKVVDEVSPINEIEQAGELVDDFDDVPATNSFAAAFSDIKTAEEPTVKPKVSKKKEKVQREEAQEKIAKIEKEGEDLEKGIKGTGKVEDQAGEASVVEDEDVARAEKELEKMVAPEVEVPANVEADIDALLDRNSELQLLIAEEKADPLGDRETVAEYQSEIRTNKAKVQGLKGIKAAPLKKRQVATEIDSAPETEIDFNESIVSNNKFEKRRKAADKGRKYQKGVEYVKEALTILKKIHKHPFVVYMADVNIADIDKTGRIPSEWQQEMEEAIDAAYDYNPIRLDEYIDQEGEFVNSNGEKYATELLGWSGIDPITETPVVFGVVAGPDGNIWPQWSHPTTYGFDSSDIESKVRRSRLSVVKDTVDYSIFDWNRGYSYVDTSEEHLSKLRKAFNGFKAKFKIPESMLKIEFVDKLEDLPKDLRNKIYEKYPRGSKKIPRALYSTMYGESAVYVIGAAQEGPINMFTSLTHEIIGHHGIRSIFGNDWDVFMSKSLINTSDLFQRAYDTIVAKNNVYGFDFKKRRNEEGIDVIWNGKSQTVHKDSAVKLLDEYIASLAENLSKPGFTRNLSKEELSFWTRLKAWIRHKLRSFGIGTKHREYALTDKDIYGLLTEIHARYVEDSPFKSIITKQQEMMEKYGGPNALQLSSDLYGSSTYVNEENEVEFYPSVHESIQLTTRLGNQISRMKKLMISRGTVDQFMKQKGIRQIDKDMVNSILDDMPDPQRFNKHDFLRKLQDRLYPLMDDQTTTYSDYGIINLGYELFDDEVFQAKVGTLEYQFPGYALGDKTASKEFKTHLEMIKDDQGFKLQQSVLSELRNATRTTLYGEDEQHIIDLELAAKDYNNDKISIDEYLSLIFDLNVEDMVEYEEMQVDVNLPYNVSTTIYKTPFLMPESSHFSGESENYAGHTRTFDIMDERYLAEVQSDTGQKSNKNKEPLTVGERVEVERNVENLEDFISNVNQLSDIIGAESIAKDLLRTLEMDESLLMKDFKQTIDWLKETHSMYIGMFSPLSTDFELIMESDEKYNNYIINNLDRFRVEAQDTLGRYQLKLFENEDPIWTEQFKPYIFERLIQEDVARAINDGKREYYFPNHDTVAAVEGWYLSQYGNKYTDTLPKGEVERLQKIVDEDYNYGRGSGVRLTGRIDITQDGEIRFEHTRGTGSYTNNVEKRKFVVNRHSLNEFLFEEVNAAEIINKVNRMSTEEKLINKKNRTTEFYYVKHFNFMQESDPKRYPTVESYNESQLAQKRKTLNHTKNHPDEIAPVVHSLFGLWERYKKDFPRYVKDKYNATEVVDKKGNHWYKIDLEKQKDPIVSFQIDRGVNNTEALSSALRQGVPLAQAQAVMSLTGEGWGQNNRKWFGERYDQLLSAFRKKFPKTLTALDPTKNLPFGSMKKFAHNISLGKKDASDKLAKDAEKILKGYTQEQKASAIEYFSTRDADIERYDLPHPQKMEEFKAAIADLGQMLVDLGVLRQETYDSNKGSYLPGRYMKYISRYPGSGKKVSPMFYLRQTDPELTTEEKVNLGQILDAEFIIPEMLSTIGRDVSLLEYTSLLSQLSDAEHLGWVLGGGKIELSDNSSHNMFEMEETIQRWEKQLATGVNTSPHSMTRVQWNALRDLNNEAKEALNQKKLGLDAEIRRHLPNLEPTQPIPNSFVSSLINEKYKKVPKGREYGFFSNQYVRTELYDELVDTIAVYNREEMDAISRIVAPHGLLETAHQVWKSNKVVWNIGAWFRNAAGNMSLLDISTPTNSVKLTKMLIEEGHKAFNNNESKYWKLAREHGLFGSTFSANELWLLNQQWSEKQKRKLERSHSAAGVIKKGFWAVSEQWYVMSEILSQGYGGLEGIYKTVSMRDHIERWEKDNGRLFDDLSVNEQMALSARAADEANNAIFDYSDIPGWLRTLRRSPLGAPFLTFTYKALPATMRGMANNPQKFIKYIALPYAMTYMATAFGDLDEDDIEEFEKKASKWMQEKSSVYLLPWKDKNDNVQAMDFGYFFPWTAFSDVWNKTNINWNNDEPLISMSRLTGDVTSSMGLLGGPLPSMIGAGMFNKDSFLGNDIVNPGSTQGDKLIKSMSWLYDLWMPSWLGSKGVAGKLMDRMGYMPDVLSNQKDMFGGDKSTTGQDLARLVGANIYSTNPDVSNIQNVKSFSYESAEVKKQRAKLMKNKNISTQDKINGLKEYNGKLMRINERRQSYFKQGF